MSDDRDLEGLQSGCSQEGAHHSSNEEGELEQGQGLGPASGLPTGMGPLPSPATLSRRPSSENGHVHQQQVEVQVQEQQQEQVKKEDQAPLLLDAARIGGVSVVPERLQAGASDQDGGKALWAAAQEDRTEVVHALLEAGAHPDAADEDGGTALQKAARGGHLEVVRALLAAGAQLDAADKFGRTALWIAANGGHLEVVHALLAAGAKLDAAGKDGRTALMQAARNGHVEVIRALLEAGAKLDVADQYGGTALMQAAKNGHVEVVRELIEAGAKMDVANKYGGTALMVAAENGHVEVVRALLEAGAKLDVAKEYGGTALMQAAENGHVEVVRELIEAGAKMDVANKDGDTALMLAAPWGGSEVFRALLEAGAKIDVANKDGYTALMLAAHWGRSEVVRALLAAGAKIDVANKVGCTALMQAAGKAQLEDVRGDLEVVRALLAAGAKMDVADKDGQTALMLAARRGHVDAIRALLEAGAKADVVNKDGDTALMLAAHWGRSEVVRALLEAGAKADVANKVGNTALWEAACRGHVDVVRALLEAGAKADVANKDGRTVLWGAACQGHVKVVRALLEAGAKLDAADKYGVTPLLAAAKMGHTGVIKMFIEVGALEKATLSPLHLAIVKRQKDMVILQLEAGVDVVDVEVAKGGLCPLGLATMLGFADIANALVARGASASGLPLEREEVQHQVEDMKIKMAILGLQPPKMELPEDAHLPAELLAFYCRAVLADNTSEHGEDYIGRIVDRLASSMSAAWPAAYCSAQDALLTSGSQTAALLQDLAGRRQLTDAIRLLQNLEVVPPCPVLAIDQLVANTQRMAFNPSGRLLAAGTTSQIINLWDLQTGVHRTLGGDSGDSEGVCCLSFSNGSKLLASGYSNKQVCVYDLDSGERVNPGDGFNHTTTAIAFSCDGSRLACLTVDGHIHIYNTESWAKTWAAPCDFEGRVLLASIHAKGDAMYLAITCEHSNEVRVYTIPVKAEQGWRAGNEAMAKAVVVLKHDSLVKHMAVSADCRLIATLENPCGNEQLQLWDMATGVKLGNAVGMGGVALCMAISPNGRRLAIGRKSEAVQVYKLSEDGISPLPASLYSPLPDCISLVFSADGKRLAAADYKSGNCNLHVWDVAFSNISWPAAGSFDPTPESRGARVNIPNTVIIKSCFRRPLFYGGAESLIPITYTSSDTDGSSGGVGAFTSSWLKDGGQLLDVAARGDNFRKLFYDLLQSPAANKSADTLRAVASSLAPHTMAAASMALLHLGPSGVIMALLGLAWTKLLELGLLAWVKYAERGGEAGHKEASERSEAPSTDVQKALGTLGDVISGRSFNTKCSDKGSHYTVSINEVALPHAALALKGSVLEPLLADPWVPTSLWTKPAIKVLLLLRWARFTKHVVFCEFLIRTVYTGLFVTYALTMTGGSGWQDDNSGGDNGSGGRQDRCVAGGVGSGHHGMMYVLAIMTAEYVVMEARQAWGSGRRWLQHHTNLFDLVGLALMSTILGLHWSCGASLQTLRGLSAVLVLVLFWRLLYFATAIDKLGRFFRMVLQVTADLRYFFIVLGVVYAGFALAVLVLGSNLQHGSAASTTGDGSSNATSYNATSYNSSYNSTVGSLARPVFMRLYTMIYGDFGMDWVMGSDAPSSSLGNLAAVICSIYMFLVAIILLNLLIAVIGDAYEGVMHAAEMHAIREKAQLIAEMEQLLPAWFRSRRDDKLFRCERVLVLQPAASGQSDGSGPDPAGPAQQQQEWQGRVGHVQSLVEGMQTKVERRMDAVQKQQGRMEAHQGRLETQLQAQQSRLEAQLQAQQGRLEAMQALLLRMVPPNGGSDVRATGRQAETAGDEISEGH